jgi:hypothetical protein
MEYLKVWSFLLLFLLPKLVAYIYWSYISFSSFNVFLNHPKLKATAYGLLRLLIGLVMASPLFILATLIFDWQHPLVSGLIVYLIVYLPTRWLEWGLLEVIINPKSRRLAYFLCGYNEASRRWRVGGLIICAIFDVPVMLLSGGAPLGNFSMC